MYHITVETQKRNIEVTQGENLLAAPRKAGVMVDAPCGSEGHCGKCRVTVDGKEVLACQTRIDRDMVVTLPAPSSQQILSEGLFLPQATNHEGCSLAFDIGTTTVVGYLLINGAERACEIRNNPQTAFGRMSPGLKGQQEALTSCIWDCLAALTQELCLKAKILPHDIHLISVVGQTCLLLGILFAG